MRVTGFWAKAMREAPLEGTPGGEPVAAADPVSTDPSSPPAAPDLSWAGADFFDGDTFKADDFRSHYESLRAEKAARDEAASKIPEAYDFALPKDLDLGLPEGVTYALERDNPAFAPFFDELGGLLKEIGAPGEVAPKVTGLVARYEAAKIKALHEQANKEYEALGPTDAARGQRIQNVQRALEGRLPEAQAKALSGVAYTKDAVMALEALLTASAPRSPTSAPSGGLPDTATPMERLRAANAAL